jgi:glycosyltransferase involved in cell wall biosynthesis
MLPKVLVVSNDPISKECSNGRTMGELLLHYPTDRLAELYTNDRPLDMIDCSYFLLSDAMLIKHTKCFKRPGEERHYVANATTGFDSRSSVRKNPLTCLVRDSLWRIGHWKSKALYSWLDAFHPDIILLQPVDMPYLFDLARKIAKREHAKLVLYNCEEFYFKKKNYLKGNGWGFLYPSWHHRIKKSLQKAIQFSTLDIHFTESLRERYDQAFPKKWSEVIYSSSDWTPVEYRPQSGPLHVVFFGGFSDGRYQSLEDLAAILKSLGSDYVFDVYGPDEPDEGFQKFIRDPDLVFHGQVSYEEVKTAAYQADLLIHVTGFDADLLDQAPSQFSTKIADCLSSGIPFFVYAPKGYGFAQYLQQNNAAFVATSKEEAKTILRKFFADPDYRSNCLAGAKALAEKNHQSALNEKKLQYLLEEVAKKS